jgi:hypothetical protein
MPKLQNGAEFRTFQNNRYLFCAISGQLYLSGSSIKLSQHVFEMHDIYCLTTKITQWSQKISQIVLQLSSIFSQFYRVSIFFLSPSGFLSSAATEQLLTRPHHSKMEKDGWAKYIQNFAFK